MRFIPLAFIFLFVAATAQAGSSTKALGKQFRRLDANRDDSLSISEFAKLLPSKLTKRNALVETQVAMFNWFDEDASEGIDLGEWIDGRNANGSDSSPYFSYEVQDELNANGDWKLTWKEFSRVIPKYVASKTARAWFDEITSSSSTGSSVSLGSSSSGSSYTLSGGTLSLGWSGDWNFVQSVTMFFEAGNVSDSASIVSGSTLTLAPSDDSTTLTFPSDVTPSDSSNGDISVVVDLTKTGSGTLTLDSANTYTGSTTVSSGSLDSSHTVDSGVSLSVVSGFDFADTGTSTLSFIGFEQSDASGSFILTAEMMNTYYLSDPVSETSASLIDQGSAPVPE